MVMILGAVNARHVGNRHPDAHLASTSLFHKISEFLARIGVEVNRHAFHFGFHNIRRDIKGLAIKGK